MKIDVYSESFLVFYKDLLDEGKKYLPQKNWETREYKNNSYQLWDWKTLDGQTTLINRVMAPSEYRASYWNDIKSKHNTQIKKHENKRLKEPAIYPQEISAFIIALGFLGYKIPKKLRGNILEIEEAKTLYAQFLKKKCAKFLASHPEIKVMDADITIIPKQTDPENVEVEKPPILITKENDNVVNDEENVEDEKFAILTTEENGIVVSDDENIEDEKSVILVNKENDNVVNDDEKFINTLFILEEIETTSLNNESFDLLSLDEITSNDEPFFEKFYELKNVTLETQSQKNDEENKEDLKTDIHVDMPLKTEDETENSSKNDLSKEIENLVKSFCLSVSKHKFKEASVFLSESYLNKDIKKRLKFKYDIPDLRFSFIYTLDIRNISFFDVNDREEVISCKTYHKELILTPVLKNGDFNSFIASGLNQELLKKEKKSYIEALKFEGGIVEIPVYNTTITQNIREKYEANLDLSSELLGNQFLATITKLYQYEFEYIGNKLCISSFKEIEVLPTIEKSGTIKPDEKASELEIGNVNNGDEKIIGKEKIEKKPVHKINGVDWIEYYNQVKRGEIKNKFHIFLKNRESAENEKEKIKTPVTSRKVPNLNTVYEPEKFQDSTRTFTHIKPVSVFKPSSLRLAMLSEELKDFIKNFKL